MTEAQIAFLPAMPAWMTAVGRSACGARFVGSILLLLRSKWALHVFVISFAAFVLSLIYTYGSPTAHEVNGASGA